MEYKCSSRIDGGGDRDERNGEKVSPFLENYRSYFMIRLWAVS